MLLRLSVALLNGNHIRVIIRPRTVSVSNRNLESVTTAQLSVVLFARRVAEIEANTLSYYQ